VESIERERHLIICHLLPAEFRQILALSFREILKKLRKANTEERKVVIIAALSIR
jgi:hypothetical protein